MTSIRKAIRKNIATALMNNTDAEANVFASRTRKISAKSLPAILVYTREETAEVFNESPRELKRVVSVAIEIAARADEDLDDQLDDIAQQVEDIMSEQQTLEDVASDVLLTRTEIQLTADGDNQHGACILTYDVTYYEEDVSQGVEGPGVPAANVLKPFVTAGVEYKVPPFADGQPAAEDKISLPQ